MRISLVNICCVCLILFLTGGAWHIYAEEVSLNILRKGELAVKKSTVIHPAAEQLQLSRQLTKIAEKSPDYQIFPYLYIFIIMIDLQVQICVLYP